MRDVCVLKFGSVGWPVGQSCNPTACLCVTCQINRADSFEAFTSRKCLVLRSRSITCRCLRYTSWLAVVHTLRPNYNSRLSVKRFWTGHFQNWKSFLSLLLLMGNCFVWCDVVGECELCAAGSSVFSSFFFLSPHVEQRGSWSILPGHHFFISSSMRGKVPRFFGMSRKGGMWVMQASDWTLSRVVKLPRRFAQGAIPVLPAVSGRTLLTCLTSRDLVRARLVSMSATLFLFLFFFSWLMSVHTHIWHKARYCFCLTV